MTVKKSVPCSLLDIRGIQEWLDEMALQGLFLVCVNRRFDRAEFELRDPAPVRYRLDPVGKDTEKDKEREEPYAQMGWKFVDYIPRWYYIFSCDDPAAPELYSDPQSLAIAMEPMVRREIWTYIWLALFLLGTCSLFYFMTPGSTVRNLLLWENPQELLFTALYPLLLVLCIPLLFLEVRRIIKIRDTLAQGLTLKAKRRRNRIPYLAWYIPLYLCIFLLPRLLLPRVGWEVLDLDVAVLSYPWPTAAQIEAVGPSPLVEEPAVDGYVRLNDSPFAPVQEEVNRYRMLHPDDLTDHDLSTTIRYVRADSPRTARWIYRLELDRVFKSLEERQAIRYTYRITELTPFTLQSWPGLDRLEVTHYQERGQDSWTFAALRGNDVLLVDYTGSVRWEDCLPLFLEALPE